jgi:nucleotide-binding universal stress UspA family protein
VRAGAWAAGLARRQGSRLICLFVATQPAFAGMALGMGADVPVDISQDEVARELVKELREAVDTYHVRAEFLMRSGDPVTEITRLADEVKVDAVVVGASMQAGHRLVGSVAVRLVRAGRWPVTVVP